MSDTCFVNQLDWKTIPLDRDVSLSIGDDFQMKFLAAVCTCDPDNIEVLIRLADLYTKHNLVRESLDIDLKLVQLCPEERVFHYNLACSYSLMGRIDSSLLAFEKALLLGYDNLEQINADRDLDNLKMDNRFKRLMKEHFKVELQP